MKSRSKRSLLGSGELFVWLSGAALALSLFLVVGMLSLIVYNGAGLFWPGHLALLNMKDGTRVLGEIVEREFDGTNQKIKIKRSNRDLTGSDFVWITESDVTSISYPPDAIVLERREWGNFLGFPQSLKVGSQSEAEVGAVTLSRINSLIATATDRFEKVRSIERGEIGAINFRKERLRLELKRLDREGESASSAVRTEIDRENAELIAKYIAAEQEISLLKSEPGAEIIIQPASGEAHTISFDTVVRAYQPNVMGFGQKLSFYFQKFWEFVSDDPRESNTEGGVFPAIFGTVMMVFIMSIVVTPLGVLAAIYLREYAKQGRIVSIVRIAVNNLAGVPSIVFGVFGVGFFIYIVGGSIDSLFYPDALPTPTYGTGGILWASLTLALLTVPTVIVATEEGLASIPHSLREGSYALGATKFETTWRVVLPALAPSIFTGMILAVARAAGEVAPLMVTGVVKLAPTLPLDSNWPFIHLDRKFMHLGFHIYDVGFQSPNVDAARPMVFTTALLLLCIVVSLNLFAIVMRNRLRRRFMVSAV